MRRRVLWAFAMAALGLAGCGGGGTVQPGPAPAGNAAPTFTSVATVNVAENVAGPFYQATATDPDGDPLTFGLAGGPDGPRFTITTAGALAFATPPDFEAPADADGNNVYQVTLSVSDGTTSATLNLSVTVTNAGQDSFRVARVGTGFASPVFVAPVPDNSGRVFVVQQAGLIRILNPANGSVAPTPFLDVTTQTTTNGERGLLGLATAPDFATSGNFYVFLTNLAGNIEVRRYRTLAGNRDQADPASGDLILAIPHPGQSNHNGGWIGFGPDGFLYVATGDGGGAGDPGGNAQNRNSLLGKILRIDVAGDAFPGDPSRDYVIPAGNPFAAGGGAPEVWAFGLRNPYRNSFDAVTGQLWIADVGQGAREEIDLMRPTDGGANFGWNVVEGTANFTGPPQAGFTPPVAEYAHGNGPREGNSVTGGYVYRGPVEALRGQYIFADFVRPNIWSFPIDRVAIGATLASSQFVLRNADFAPDAGSINNVASFGVDQAGNLYIVDYDGEIFRIEPA
ncbi:MAG: PQQ-dependent sugar dehydrogenase [Sphingomonas sp.]